MFRILILSCYLFLVAAFVQTYAADNGSGGYYLKTVPSEGVLLDQGWRFHPGDNPAWAEPAFDDSKWQLINPTSEIHTIKPLREAQIGWFRLHLHLDTSLLNQTLALLITQRGASEIYLNGRLLHRLGIVSKNPAEEVIYNPNNTPYSVQVKNQQDVVLAVRYSYTKANLSFNQNAWLGNPCLVIRLQRMDDAVTNLVYDRSYGGFKEYGKAGLFFILGLLHLFLFLSYRIERTNLYYCIYAFTSALHGLLIYQVIYLPRSGLSFFFMASLAYFLNAQSLLWALLALYTYAQQRVGGVFWATLATLFLTMAFAFMPYRQADYFITVLVWFYTFDAIRVSWLGVKAHIPDSWLSLAGWLGFGLFGTTYQLAIYRVLPFSYLVIDILFHCALFWLTFSFSLLLARQYARTNRNLSQKLLEVRALSAKTLAQQQEKQQLLATENERLEKQVRERTEEIQAQNEVLARQAERLQEQDGLKSRFITNLTHEFRTPLSLILSPVEKLLRDTSAPAHYRSLLSVIDKNARQLLSLVNQLLDLSKIDAGHMSISEQSMPPAGLVEDVLELFRPQMENKGIKLQWFAEGGRENYLLDSDKWNKILRNLLSNAVKFTPAGGSITVRLQVVDKKAFIEIADTGRGIVPEKLPYIFDRFYQADDSTTRAYEGTGIGLALVKELTRLLGGSIEVESKAGKGTICHLSLPLSYTQPVAAGSIDKTTEANYHLHSGVEIHTSLPRADDKPVVLVVEDNVDLRVFLAEELSASYRVLTATNGIEGWDLVRHELPDIVVSDVMMPGLDGFSLTGLIKSNPITNHIAVVLLTARTAQESRLEGLTGGADDYLVKPFHWEELLLRLRNLLLRRSTLQAYFQKHVLLGGKQAETEPPIDPFLTRLYEIIEARLDDSTLGVETLAQEVGMSRRTLHRKVTALTNLSVQELMRQYRLRRATQLLQSGHNVSETAYLVGYESPAHFTATFKALYQQTPTEFLSQQMEKGISSKL